MKALAFTFLTLLSLTTFAKSDDIQGVLAPYDMRQQQCSVSGHYETCRWQEYYVSGCSVSCPEGKTADCQQGNVWDTGAYCRVYHSECYCL